MTTNSCRFCSAPLHYSFCDLGMSPFSNAYLEESQLQQMEPFYPLHAYVCSDCLLVQLQEFESPQEIFSDYAYFSSYSESWLVHAKAYTDYMIQRFGFNDKSQIIEVASNDGYLLKYFKEKKIPVLGIEPAKNIADAAIAAGIPTVNDFFGTRLAKELRAQSNKADLLLGNNVLAHVPDLNDFVSAMKLVLKPTGIITVEFPHLLQLIEQNQFDTIYHEHFSYFSFITIQRIFKKHSLTIFDVEEIPTHGGSLRIFSQHAEDLSRPVSASIEKLRTKEETAGLLDLQTYQAFLERAHLMKRNLLGFLIQAKKEGKTIAGYGAPAKGNTLLNFCGIRTDFIDYTVDQSPHKQGKFLPGTHIAVYHPDRISETRPDYLLILPWNLKEEIVDQMGHIREWGGKFVIPIPEVEVLS